MSRSIELKSIYPSLIRRIEGWNLRKITKVFFILGMIIALVGSFFWYSRIYMTKERRFWSAISNSMSTKSITRTLVSGGSGNQASQSQRFAFSPQMASENRVVFSQKSALVDTNVVTEGVIFPDAQYSRYVSFSTNQQLSDGSSPSLNSILGKWEANEVPEESLDQARLSYVGELVTLVIFANIDSDLRRDVVDNFRENEVYKINIENIREEEVDGDSVYVYPVDVALKSYATQLQKVFVASGYGDFPPLNPDNYREDSRISAEILVSRRSNNIVGISFGQRQESYTGHGIHRTIVRPESEFNAGELETRVQSELQGILQ